MSYGVIRDGYEEDRPENVFVNHIDGIRQTANVFSSWVTAPWALRPAGVHKDAASIQDLQVTYTHSNYERIINVGTKSNKNEENLASVSFLNGNPDQVLALAILDTILKARIGRPSEKLVFPDERLKLHHHRLPSNRVRFGDVLFDEGLSFCSCLHLARYILVERKGIYVSTEGVIIAAEYFGDLDKIRTAI